MRIYGYHQENPATGAHNLTCALASGTLSAVAVAIADFNGVDVAGTPLGTSVANTGNSSGPTSGSITCPANGMLWGSELNQYATAVPTAGSGTTLGGTVRSGGNGYCAAAGYRTSTGAVAYSLTGGTPWTTLTHILNPVLVPAAAVTGTVTTATEADIVAGGKTIILTLTDDTWVAAGGTFDGQRANIIAGLTSATSEALGWNNVVKALQGVAGVVRTSSTVVTITLDAQATYCIASNDGPITVTIPSTAVTAAGAIVATPTFTITASGATSLFRNSPSGQLSGLGSSGKFFQNPLQ